VLKKERQQRRLARCQRTTKEGKMTKERKYSGISKPRAEISLLQRFGIAQASMKTSRANQKL
jgi:hypothetical protein